ncbi:MAG: osmotically inducible protein OsmC [Thermoplasmata archaeon]|mgnify:CR=1 FL=1|nr:MAG: osmotically inducible protein OsmC [Thermoplasmata archaeon]RLF37221.1 MAG: osmotically inducible protein OsmC [Thermoplasmata archaeon]RLF51774.1 MAG: osmotically inducible protein OsmC [Thermoplasmata archaeon]
MEVIIKQVEGLTFVAKGDSNHWVAIDGPTEFFGSEAGTRPMELLLIALGSCTASDVAAILQKKRAKLEKFEVRIQGDREDVHPKVFTKIHINYVFTGKELKEEDVKRAIELSQEKYCPISTMLKKTVHLTYSYEII